MAYLCLLMVEISKIEKVLLIFLGQWNFRGYINQVLFVTRFNIQKLSHLPTQRIYVFCVCHLTNRCIFDTHSIKTMEVITDSAFTARYELKYIIIQITFDV